MTVAARLRTVPAVAFSPSQVGNLAAWYAADAITGLSDGAAVATWNDASANTFHATQGTAGNRPTWETGELNGKPVVRFDGTDDYLGSALPSDVAASTMLAVAKATNFTGTVSLLGPLGGNGRLLRVDTDASIDLVHTGVALLGASTSNVTAGVWAIIDASYATSGAYAFNLNGTAVGSGSNSTSFTAGRTTSIGAEQTGATPWRGDIAEIIVYHRILADAERLSLARHLGAKYGIAVA